MDKVIVIVSGGLVTEVRGLPKGTKVEVRDYDVEYADEDIITKDEDGDEVIVSEWEV